MLPTPKKVTVVAGSGEGDHKLTAFDNALLAAGIGNLNLIKVSSILPPDCEVVEKLDIPPGSLTPTAYGTIASDVKGDRIAAAVAVGFSDRDYGTIMEFSGHCTQKEAEQAVRAMVEEAFRRRGMALREVRVAAAEMVVGDRPGAVVAAAVLWY
ncbi:arginine decarboxylase, pyruvoyl-dependent [Thermaerobacter sp. PB12/4term]|uniref:pyruvoyl-dependent arginine decarboxylase n=1 Tax=Thermaerobacter sp. PB12/4term TaxID=2293838 RepID=UPI000E32BE0E|nr:arginine decarboxylase, pyruvoyl-dependent [Thermaerobacter sp. PB12/4term]QIA28092.1 arginine decarboxylase, pyruvoyl-dependent [Thermaerobacter sp. PB12/4term]